MQTRAQKMMRREKKPFRQKQPMGKLSKEKRVKSNKSSGNINKYAKYTCHTVFFSNNKPTFGTEYRSYSNAILNHIGYTFNHLQ